MSITKPGSKNIALPRQSPHRLELSWIKASWQNTEPLSWFSFSVSYKVKGCKPLSKWLSANPTGFIWHTGSRTNSQKWLKTDWRKSENCQAELLDWPDWLVSDLSDTKNISSLQDRPGWPDFTDFNTGNDESIARSSLWSSRLLGTVTMLFWAKRTVGTLGAQRTGLVWSGLDLSQLHSKRSG